MQNRTIHQSPIVKARKISSAKENKPTTSSTKSGGLHKTCAQLPTALVKPRPPSGKAKIPSTSTSCKKPAENIVSSKSIQQKQTPPLQTRPEKSSNLPATTDKSRPPLVNSKTPSTLSTNCKKPVSKQASQLTQQKPAPSSPPDLEATLKGEESKKLISKFAEVSASILQVTTSGRPLGTRSLEALINHEISNSLGDAINNPKFSQGFTQATRGLLEKLVSLYEGGKLNPKLLRDRTNENKSFIRANSATTVCYRDRYFKELVMNVLQSMTSSELEEEVANQTAHSEESRERIRTIREMVRTEAGLEPEDFRQLEQRLEELKESLFRNKLEVEKATLEVDRIISQHTVEEESLSRLQIPKPAREVLRTVYKERSELESDCGKIEKGGCENGKGCCEKSCSTSKASNGNEKYKKSISIIGGEECFEKGNSDEVKNIRPQLKHLLHEELLRIKMKEEEILNRDREFDRINELQDTPKSSFESVEFRSAASNFSDKEDDEISEEETHTFLKVLKAQIEERNIMNEDILNTVPQGVCVTVLPRIDEDENEMNYRELAEETDSSSIQSETSPCSEKNSSIDLEPLNENLNDIGQHNTRHIEHQPSERDMVERVKSKWLNREESDINDVVAEMKEAFEMFRVMSDVFSTFRISEEYKKETGDTEEASKFNCNKDFHLWDFTVGEVANVLVNISIKINNLPQYLQETALNNSKIQKEQAFNILSVLEKCVDSSNPAENDVTVTLEEASAYLPIKKFAKTFSFLSDSLSSSPIELKSEPISALKPPQSLIETLSALSSTTYFRDCFTSVKKYSDKQAKTGKSIEVVKPYNMNEQRSSREIHIVNSSTLGEDSRGSRNKIYTYTRDIKRPEDIKKNINQFEHLMGLTASVMTVQNVSDMFLFLSTVLNDVPDRLKSEKILDLDPPFSLLKALDILYSEEEIESITELEKKKSFASLTIQNVSDFLLTLSKTFDDIPERLKDSTVADLKPPQSLLRAITLLTSLSHCSIKESCSEEIEEENHEEKISNENQEKFFDAVSSLGAISVKSS